MNNRSIAWTRACLLGGLLGVLGMACASDPHSTRADASMALPAQSSSCAPLNETRMCACGNLPGRSTCTAQGFSACECASAPAADGGVAGALDTASADDGGVLGEPAGDRRADIVFSWHRAVPLSGTCEAGHYVGETTCDFQAVGLPIGPLPSTLDFVLGKTQHGEILEISNGKISSISAAGTVQMGDLVGSLDCSTRKFTAHIENGTIVAYGATGKTQGTLVGDYDATTHSFVNATYDGTGDISGIPGGCMPGSTWKASWQP